MQKLSNLPVESFLPLLLMKHLGSFAKDFEVTPDFLEYGFDTEMIFDAQKSKNQAKKKSLLKEIETEFSSQKMADSDDRAVQIIIDENAINSYLLEFVMMDKSISARDQLDVDPKLRQFADYMTTTNLGLLMPEILEEYGEKKIMDVMFSLSHNLIKDKLDG